MNWRTVRSVIKYQVLRFVVYAVPLGVALSVSTFMPRFTPGSGT